MTISRTDSDITMFNIYFAGSIRGGRDDARLYARLIRYLSEFGTVLTAHVGDDELLKEEQYLTEGQIYDRDMKWLDAAHCVIAEVSTPSLGVGVELGLAQNMEKNILCLYRPGADRSLSAMIAGNPAYHVVNYSKIHEAEDVIKKWLLTLPDFTAGPGQN